MNKDVQKIKLSDWAEKNKMPYKKAWNLIQAGEFPDKYEKSKNGRIKVLQEAKANKVSFIQPQMGDKVEKILSTASSPQRRNKVATSDMADQYSNIWAGIEPFVFGYGGYDKGMIRASEAIRLCQKAYWNFSVFKNIIDAMTEFSISNIYLRGGSQKVKDFFYSLFRKINLQQFLDEFFREYYRSGNVFIYRFDSKVQQDDIPKLNQTFGIPSNASKKLDLPLKYITLNPTDVEVQANVSFANPYIFKRFTGYEVARLRNPQTEQEKELYKSLSP
jgi:hypothetical protein